MKYRYLCLLSSLMITGGMCTAQINQAQVVEDFKVSSTTQPGNQYPQVNSEGRVRTSIAAPQALKVPPGTAHEWLTWRRCLYEFAPQLFKK